MGLSIVTITLAPAIIDVAAVDSAAKEAAGATNRGPEWRCLLAQSTIVHALAGAHLGAAGPEHIAWVQILLRAFHCLEGARSLLTRDADVVAEALHRVASEIRLHQMIIRDPWVRHLTSGAGPKASPADAWADVRSRLRAYTAWALASDREFAAARANPAELAEIYPPTRPEELPSSPKEALLLDFVFGEMAIVSEAEAALDQSRARADFLSDVARLDDWLSDSRLLPWVARIDQRRKRNGGRVTSSFGELFDPSYHNIRQCLAALGTTHEYASYARASRLLHGNTIDLMTWACVHAGGITGLVPRVLPRKDYAEAAVLAIANTMSQVACFMWAMRDHVLPDQET